MVMNLFDSMDPSASLLTNWLGYVFVFSFIPLTYYLGLNRMGLIFSKLVLFFSSDLDPLTGLNNLMVWAISLFFLIFSLNFYGLLPHYFSITSHPSCTFSLAFMVWLGIMSYGMFCYFTLSLAHLTPQEAPGSLLFFLVLVETVSQMIRPLTLSLRLAANLTAGHLLLTMLSDLYSSAFPFVVSMGILGVVHPLFLFLELAVAFIQAYIFVTLVNLYLGEHPA